MVSNCFVGDMVDWKPHVLFHIYEKWDSQRMFMIGFNYDECNIINLMIIVGMFRMNYMINGLVIQQMCLETWYVVQYVD
jgi:hypothetical protein